MITRKEVREEVRNELAALRVNLITREDLQKELAALRAEMATKQELAALREETAAGFADMRRYMEILYEDLKGTMRTVIEMLSARMEARDLTVDRRLDAHEQRLENLDLRVTRLEH